MRNYTDSSLYYYSKNWNRFIICVKSALSNEMKQCLDDPDSFIDKGVLLKNGNSSTVSSVKINNTQLVIKRYNIKDHVHAVSRAFRPSRASVSWENAHLLDECHIATAAPVAFLEYRCGFLRSTSYLITELKAGDRCSDYFNLDKYSDVDKKKAAYSIVDILKKLKALKITHGDLKLSNIIIYNTAASLIDLDSMKQHKNNASFLKAHEKDMSRFFLNWKNDDKNRNLFLDIYNNEK